MLPSGGSFLLLMGLTHPSLPLPQSRSVKKGGGGGNVSIAPGNQLLITDQGLKGHCLDRKAPGECTVLDQPGQWRHRRLFQAFGWPVCADRISNCPLDSVLTNTNLIYLLNLQFCHISPLLLLFTVLECFERV